MLSRTALGVGPTAPAPIGAGMHFAPSATQPPPVHPIGRRGADATTARSPAGPLGALALTKGLLHGLRL